MKLKTKFYALATALLAGVVVLGVLLGNIRVTGPEAAMAQTPSASASATAAPAPAPATTATTTVTTTNPPRLARTGGGQPAVHDVEELDADFLKKICEDLPSGGERSRWFLAGREVVGGDWYLIRVCFNPDVLSEEKGTYTVHDQIAKLGLSQTPTCAQVDPANTGPKVATIDDWKSGNAGSDVRFKRFEGGTGVLSKPQVVRFDLCGSETVTQNAPAYKPAHHRPRQPCPKCTTQGPPPPVPPPPAPPPPEVVDDDPPVVNVDPRKGNGR